MAEHVTFHKTDFGEIYDQPDPRQYYATLRPHEYAIPAIGAQLFDQLVRLRATRDENRPFRILDLCCSYGIVGMLMKTDLSMDDLYAHYARFPGLTPDEMAAQDRRLLDERRRASVPDVIGLDVAENAVSYALSTGALDGGGAENLESDDPSSELAAALSEVDLITTTGGIGYITEKTFDRVLAHTPPTAWVASFCLRAYDYGPIAQSLAAHGLRTEQPEQTVKQRRFVSDDERRWAAAEVRAGDLDTTGKEDDGYLHAGFHLSRPADEAVARPISELLPNWA